MVQEAIVKRKEPELPTLPEFQEPKTIEEALCNIEGLGSNMAEHAYLVGCNLIWVKEQLEHGEFIPWVEEKMWFGRRTASGFIKYAKHCNLANSLTKYPLQANGQNLPISSITLPKGKYSIIYADPPWKYDFSQSDSRQVENQYPTMDVEDIANIDIPTTDNAVLYMWATAPKLAEALTVICDWGFDYKTHLIWDKEKIGMGYWFRGQHELLLVCTKGHVSPPIPQDRISSVLREKRGKHSKKPDIIYEWIEKWYPNQKWVELFSRNQRKGWTVWGNEV